MTNNISVFESSSHPFQHPHYVFCVVESSDLLVAFAVDNGHGLQTHTLHVRLGRQQETMIQVIEKLIAEKKRVKDGMTMIQIYAFLTLSSLLVFQHSDFNT